MTTIAWDGKTLAADSQASCSYIRQGSTKKLTVKNGKPMVRVELRRGLTASLMIMGS